MKHYFQENNQLTAGMLINGHNFRGDRQKDDFYATPSEASQQLLDVESFDGGIYEPCCGQGHISKVLIKNGYDVESSDLVDRGYGKSNIDFLMEYNTRNSRKESCIIIKANFFRRSGKKRVL